VRKIEIKDKDKDIEIEDKDIVFRRRARAWLRAHHAMPPLRESTDKDSIADLAYKP
jgi:hypothetical protein